MKKTFLITSFLASFFFFACSQEPKMSEEMYKIYGRFDLDGDSILNDSELNAWAKYKADSMIRKTGENEIAQNLHPEYKDSIQIIKRYTGEPNSAGGVDLNIVWKNKSKRTIKYAKFQVSAINAVDDEVFSEHSLYDTPQWVRVTGPIKPGQTQGYDSYWDCMWYNWTIKRCIIRNVELEYMDGTIVSFPINF